MSDTEKRLKRILHCAYNEVPYYNNIINDMLSVKDEQGDEEQEADFLTPELFAQMPLFDKRKLIEIGWENCVSGRYLDASYRPVLDHARMERTSGTSGPPMSILWNNRDFLASNRYHWIYRYQNFGITPSSRMCTTSMRTFGDDVCQIEPDENRMKFCTRVLNQDTVVRIFEHLHAFQPEWLYLQNSALYVLVRFAKQLHLEFPASIKYIEYIGEPLCQYYREEIKKFLPVPTSNMYGCVETNGIAYECKERHLHLMPDNVYTEIVDQEGNCLPDGEVGCVCVTGLHNTAMPMLRYRLNDRASVITDRKCPCGNMNPILELHAARIPEYLILDNPAVYPNAALYHPINCGVDLFSVESDDVQFNLRMNELDHYEVYVYHNPTGVKNIGELLRDIFDAYGLPDVRFTVRKVDEPAPSRPAGLLRMR